MNRFVVPFLESLHHLFKRLHQLEKRDGLDLCSFAAFFTDLRIILSEYFPV